MEEYILIGKISGTHGIKGEIRINSNYSIKDKIFLPDTKLYIGPNKKEVLITSYRYHKIYDMVTLKDYNNINEVLAFKGQNVYIKKEDLPNNEFIIEELVGFEIIENDLVIGQVKEIIKNKQNILLKIIGDQSFYLPYCDEYIISIKNKEKKILVKNIEGLIL